MEYEIKMPKFGISMVEGELVTWFKEEGDHVDEGEAVCEFSENKATHEIESEKAGTLTKICVQEGETVGVGTTLGVITCD